MKRKLVITLRATILLHFMLVLALSGMANMRCTDNSGWKYKKAETSSARWIDEYSLELKFSAPLSVPVRSVYQYRIEPLFCMEGDSVSVFPSLLYLTANGKRFFDRRQTNALTAVTYPVHSILKRNDRLSDSIYTYVDTLSVRRADMDGDVRLRYWLADCCSEILLDSSVVAVQPYEVKKPVLEVEAEKPVERIEQIELYIDYPLDISEIYPDYMGNPEQLHYLANKIGMLLSDIQANRITRIVLEGYASPEGRYGHNVDLSVWRAEALARYIESRYGISEELIQSVGKGENWEGLYEKVLTDDSVPYREEVLNLLKPDKDGVVVPCKEKLESLRGGKPYKYLLRKVYPHLRKTVVKVYYRKGT